MVWSHICDLQDPDTMEPGIQLYIQEARGCFILEALLKLPPTSSIYKELLNSLSTVEIRENLNELSIERSGGGAVALLSLIKEANKANPNSTRIEKKATSKGRKVTNSKRK